MFFGLGQGKWSIAQEFVGWLIPLEDLVSSSKFEFGDRVEKRVAYF